MNKPWKLTKKMFLSEEEIKNLLEDLQEKLNQAEGKQYSRIFTDLLIVKSLLFSGLRNSEFCNLRVQDTMIGQKKSVFNVEGTPRQDRTVHVPKALSQTVKEFVKEVRPSLLPDDINPNDETVPLIFNERGKPYERTGLYRRVIRILKSVGLENRASVQFFRHTYGYLGYKNTGGNLIFLQKQLGHSHPMVTAIYAQFVDESYPEMADHLMEQFVTKSST